MGLRIDTDRDRDGCTYVEVPLCVGSFDLI